jgi:hypothetical protein
MTGIVASNTEQLTASPIRRLVSPRLKQGDGIVALLRYFTGEFRSMPGLVRDTFIDANCLRIGNLYALSTLIHLTRSSPHEWQPPVALVDTAFRYAVDQG